ncbi:MAG: hypothetical protein C0485_03220 [Pirellula sp.]|nr:hypothetical protein [Pirellula sp.]
MTAWLPAALALLLAAGGLATLPRVRGTTLTAPTLWWIAAAAAIAAVEAMLAYSQLDATTLRASLWRYSAAVGTFCPLTAVLGAKRPQDRGWQWVVASLWLVLLVPVAQAIASPGGTQLELFGAWRWLLWGFIAMGLLNYLPTRFALSALLVAAGQIILLGAPTGIAQELSPTTRIAAALTLFLAACGLATLRRFRAPPSTLPQTTRWLAFRDAWGVFWALRILQRVNQTAELSGWPVRLQWNGLVSTDEPAAPTTLAPQVEAVVNQSLDTLLRRFERVD